MPAGIAAAAIGAAGSIAASQMGSSAQASGSKKAARMLQASQGRASGYSQTGAANARARYSPWAQQGLQSQNQLNYLLGNDTYLPAQPRRADFGSDEDYRRAMTEWGNQAKLYPGAQLSLSPMPDAANYRNNKGKFLKKAYDNDMQAWQRETQMASSAMGIATAQKPSQKDFIIGRKKNGKPIYDTEKFNAATNAYNDQVKGGALGSAPNQADFMVFRKNAKGRELRGQPKILDQAAYQAATQAYADQVKQIAQQRAQTQSGGASDSSAAGAGGGQGSLLRDFTQADYLNDPQHYGTGELTADAYKNDPGYTPIPRTLEELQATPGYQFRQQQGEEALNRQAAARGQFFSGAAMSDLDKFNSGLASEEYGNAWNRGQQAYSDWFNRTTQAYNNAFQRNMAQRQQKYAMLSGQSAQGLAAAGAQAGVDMQAAQDRGNWEMQQGATGAQNAMNQANADANMWNTVGQTAGAIGQAGMYYYGRNGGAKGGTAGTPGAVTGGGYNPAGGNMAALNSSVAQNPNALNLYR